MARWIFRLPDELAGRAEARFGDDHGAKSKWLLEAVEEKLARSESLDRANAAAEKAMARWNPREVDRANAATVHGALEAVAEGEGQKVVRLDRADAFRLAETRRQALKAQKPDNPAA